MIRFGTGGWRAIIGDDFIKSNIQKVAQAICNMAKTQKRINAKEKEYDNEKYAFRFFLLRLNFIGDAYKTSRKILMRNFTGSSAFKTAKSEEVA